MNIMRFLGLSSLVFTSLLLAGCAKYRPHGFSERQLQSTTSSNKATNKQNAITVSAYKLNADDTRYYFGRRIISKGFQPILLTIKNPTAQSFRLDAWDIDLKLEHARTVEKAIEFSPAQSIIAWGVLGLFLWPFFIPAAVDGVMASQANKDLAHDFAHRVISRDSYIKIRSYATTTKVMFVRTQHVKDPFEVVLTNRETREKMVFKVTV